MTKQTVPFFITHRGCPHRCVFCDQVKISGSAEGLPRKIEILQKIEEYRKTCGREMLEVAFFGGSFTSLSPESQEQLLAPLQPLLISGEVRSVRISTRPDSVDSRTAIFLKSLGVATVELGVQSMDDNVLELSGRGHGSSEVGSAVSCLKNQGLAVGIQLMPGLPGDTPEKSLDSLRRVMALKPDFLRIYPTVVISGTALEELYTNGSYRPMTLDGAIRLCKVMLHESLQSGIPVIRMGLQPTDGLRKEGVIVAGPWHPAFRQMVEAELCFDLVKSVIEGFARSGDVVGINCSPSRVSDVIGQRRMNLRRLSRQFEIYFAAVKPMSGMSRHELTVECRGEVRTANMLRDLHYNLEINENA